MTDIRDDVGSERVVNKWLAEEIFLGVLAAIWCRAYELERNR